MKSFKLEVDERLNIEGFVDVQKSIIKLGYMIDIKSRPKSGPTAALEWLLPTGVVLFIVKPYIETFLKKMAEDHYALLKEVIKRKLYPEVFQTDNKLTRYTVSGVKKDKFFTSHFSVLSKLQGQESRIVLKLMFPIDASADYFEKAIEEYAKFLSVHINDGREKELADRLIALDSGRKWTKIVWFNEIKERIELVDVVQSSKEKEFISKEILFEEK